MTAFCDLPHNLRFALRDAIEAAGGEVAGYDGDSVQVATPRAGDFYSKMEAAGLKLVTGSGHYFPLGTDKPAEYLRHDGRYPGSRGFWHYARFVYPG